MPGFYVPLLVSKFPPAGTTKSSQRLVKDFVGARLEAEETLRKQRAAALVDNAIEDTTPAGYSLSHGQRNSGRHRQREEEEKKQQQQRPGSSSSSERPDSAPRVEQQWPEAAPFQLSALRRRERELPSRLAVLDDRMTRARPTGLLATATAAKSSVSVSAVVSDSSPAVLATGPDPSRRDDDTARLVNPLGGAFMGDLSTTASSVTVAATPGRYRYGQRRRRMSVPLLLHLEDSVGGVSDRERRRPWTTSHGEAAAAEDMTREEERIETSNTVQPFR